MNSIIAEIRMPTTSLFLAQQASQRHRIADYGPAPRLRSTVYIYHVNPLLSYYQEFIQNTLSLQRNLVHGKVVFVLANLLPPQSPHQFPQTCPLLNASGQQSVRIENADRYRYHYHRENCCISNTADYQRIIIHHKSPHSHHRMGKRYGKHKNS